MPPEEIERAVLFHSHRNPHHWQFWVSYSKWGEPVAPEIPDKYLRQMAADWLAIAKGENKNKFLTDWEFYASMQKLPINQASRERLRKLIAENW